MPAGQRLVAALGADLTSVKCKGEWLTAGVSVDVLGGAAPTVDVLDSAEAADLVAWRTDVAAAVGAEPLVSDDADGFKTAADELGLSHRVCEAHVVRTTEAWVARLEPLLAADADGAMAVVRAGPDQAVADARTLLRLVRERDPTTAAATTLREIHRRYQGAPLPCKGGAASLAYRLRLCSLDRWQLWGRLTRYRTWARADGERLDGTTTPPSGRSAGGSRSATARCAATSGGPRSSTSAG